MRSRAPTGDAAEEAAAAASLATAAAIFAGNYGLHIIVLRACLAAHLGIAVFVPGVRATHGAAAVATVLLLVGRQHLAAMSDTQIARAYGISGWCLLTAPLYAAAGVSDATDSLAVAAIARSNTAVGVAALGMCAITGLLHASVAPTRNQTLGAVALVTAATASFAIKHPESATFAAFVWMAHVVGYALAAEAFEQHHLALHQLQADNLSLHESNEGHKTARERLNYDLALAQRLRRNSERALEEVRRVLKVFEREMTEPLIDGAVVAVPLPTPAALEVWTSEAANEDPDAPPEPLFVKGAAATAARRGIVTANDDDDDDSRSVATTTIDAAGARGDWRGVRRRRAPASAFAPAASPPRTKLSPELRQLFDRVAAATEPVDMSNTASLKSSDDDNPPRTLDELFNDGRDDFNENSYKYNDTKKKKNTTMPNTNQTKNRLSNKGNVRQRSERLRLHHWSNGLTSG